MNLTFDKTKLTNTGVDFIRINFSFVVVANTYIGYKPSKLSLNKAPNKREEKKKYKKEQRERTQVRTRTYKELKVIRREYLLDWIRASPAVLSMRSCTSKIGWRKVKTCCGFSSGNWFWLSIMHSLFAVAG